VPDSITLAGFVGSLLAIERIAVRAPAPQALAPVKVRPVIGRGAVPVLVIV
jgi:hypothetical protein